MPPDHADLSLLLTVPDREGPRPTTSLGMPHSQLDQHSPRDVFEALAAWLFALPDVEERRSRVSLPSSRAAWITQARTITNLLAEREFTHLHQEPGPGSQHLGLAPGDGGIVLARGWGEPHPIDGLRPGLRYLMVFAPRDLTELAIVQTIVRRAYDWTLSTSDGSRG